MKDPDLGTLVLARKVGETICIGDNITIEVRRVAGNRVALAFMAPKSVRIMRGELLEKLSDQEPQSGREGEVGRG